MSTYPPGYAAPNVPIFVPEADAISSFNTGSLAIDAGGEILLQRSESEHAVLQFNKDTAGTDFINMGVRSITILDASGNQVPATETLCYTNADNKFDIIAVGGIQIKGIEDATFEGGSAIYATADSIKIPSLVVSSINGAEFPQPQAPITSSFTQLYTETFEATKTAQADSFTALNYVSAPEITGSNLTISSINGAEYPPAQAPQISSFDTVSTQELFVSSINGHSAIQKCGMWFRSTGQTVNTLGAPSFAYVAWNLPTSWSDNSTISQNVVNGSNYTVNQKGVYDLNFQVQYSNLTAATLSDRTLRASISIIRGAGQAAVLQTNYDFGDNVPSNPSQQVGGLYELHQGDTIYMGTSQYLSTGSFVLQGRSAVPNEYDLNTSWSWNLVKPL